MSARNKRWVFLAAAVVVLQPDRAGRAEPPAPAAPSPTTGLDSADPTLARPAPPSMGAVKETVTDALKEAMGRKPGAGGANAANNANSADPSARAAFLRRKTLREEDFVDNDENNRDPFKSFLRHFVEKGSTQVRQMPAIFEKFALEELALIAIVSGDANPRAMFRDPAGLGQTVKRGDYVSKAGARITKILSDRVIVEFSEVSPTGETRPTEKAILINPEESQR